MQNTPKANRLHIAIFGRRNAGKSSIINAITKQPIALVSDVAGTTTDPVYKAMEFFPLGPVVFIDTAGFDDTGDIGSLRIKKTKKILDKTDLALLVFSSKNKDFSFEEKWYNELKNKNIPIIGIVNKIDENDINIKTFSNKFNIPFVKISAKNNININNLKKTIQTYAPTNFEQPSIVGDIINAGDTIILVTPQDIEAPKGRLILPQVQTIRDILDNNAMALTVKDTELSKILKLLNKKPDLVITDSQVFKKVNEILPEDIPLTSFSILMARYKGDLNTLIKGATAIETLNPGDKILISEACTHHPVEDDIATEKIPKWLEKKVGGKLDIKITAGVDFPENLKDYKLIIHCGACTFNRKQFMTRILKAKEMNVPITNFGTAIAYLNGILNKVTTMF